MDEPFITLEDITIRLRDKFILANTSWKILTGQHWAILGPNGAGKSSLVRVLTGDVPYVRGSITHHFPQHPSAIIGYVSSELQEHLIAREKFQDMSRYFAGKLDDFEKARTTILAVDHDGSDGLPDLGRIVDILGISHLLDRGIRYLSSGEMRKVLIARALIKSPKLLILDEPFAGIDAESQKKISESIAELVRQGLQIVLVSHRAQEILPFISNILFIKNGKVLMQGKRNDVLTTENLSRLYDVKYFDHGFTLDKRKSGTVRGTSYRNSILVDMRNVSVKYGSALVFYNLNWTVRQHEKWAIVGPSGSGKSTLMSLIAGDNPQAYANEIYLFGRRRGSGESIWDIKARIGMVSSEIQTLYRKEIKACDVVASGIFDSIGLYRNLNSGHKQQVDKWIEFFGISHIANNIFTNLSFGERRMVLLARAMVKSPELLILDEPCQGLDQENRKLLMRLIEMIGRNTDTTLLYVTHYQDELPACIDHLQTLKKPGLNEM
ncbi:MAG: ATP-binding cassette domain-containing protein [Syntrophales bacterium]|jgi:molybdate transport system ATP-binding protein